MKRTTKKVLLTAAAFSCVLNMNGCGAYGPPPDEEMNRPNTEPSTQVVLEAEEQVETTETAAEKLLAETDLFFETENMNACVYGPPPGAGGLD